MTLLLLLDGGAAAPAASDAVVDRVIEVVTDNPDVWVEFVTSGEDWTAREAGPGEEPDVRVKEATGDRPADARVRLL